MKYTTFLFALFVILSSNAQETITGDVVTAVGSNAEFPEAGGDVNDFEGVFTDSQPAELEKIIADFKNKTGNEIAVASIITIGSYESFEDYVLDLSDFWGVGQAGKNNGLTLMFSKNLRKIRIATGKGTEQCVTDDDCKKVIDTVIIPEFKKGNFYDGVRLGVLQLIALWE